MEFMVIKHSVALREVMFKTQAAVFYREIKPRGAAEWF